MILPTRLDGIIKRPGAQFVLRLFPREWVPHQETLDVVAIEMKKGSQLFDGLNAFGNYFQIKAFGYTDDGMDERQISFRTNNILNEGFIDFENVKREYLQVA